MRTVAGILILFLLSKWCLCGEELSGEGVCIVKKDNSSEEVRKCCLDWKYDFKLNKCVFSCSLGCEVGICIGPNKCGCEPPLQLVNNKCEEPRCELPCVNSECVNNTCSCHADFEKVNSTYCAPKCKPGFKRICENSSCITDLHDDPYKCVPQCTPDCVNGDCVQPGVCQCHTGYKNESNWKCSPMCDECVNEICIAPNVCQCHAGYSRSDSGLCLPHCDVPCINGFCTAPNVCSCIENYKLHITKEHNGTVAKCVPDCLDTCINGNCTISGICICNDDFELENGTCVSIKLSKLDCLDCGGNCTHGHCRCSDGRPCFSSPDPDPELVKDATFLQPNLKCGDCGVNCTGGECRCVDDSSCVTKSNLETDEVASSARLASLELSWVVGGAVSLLLLTLLIAIISHMWRRKKDYIVHSSYERGDGLGSVVYTVPNTLLNTGDGERREVDEREYDYIDDQYPPQSALLNDTALHDGDRCSANTVKTMDLKECNRV